MPDQPITLPAMTAAQEAGWRAVIDLHEQIPHGWTLVGGQMVHLWCAERGSFPIRPTDDIDTVLDVRAHPVVLWEVTAALQNLGFVAETTPEGVQHRWVNGEAVVDVLIPRYLGGIASNRRTASGGRGLQTPGAQHVINRSEQVRVRVGDRNGQVNRPTLLGAIVAKASAYTVQLDRERARHLGDLVVLATLLRPSDVRGQTLAPLEVQRIANAIGHARHHRETWANVPRGEEGIERLTGVLERN